jgi:Na+-translocating ferredoxin:NAD+ oxidoreductase RnfA subunit
MEPESLSCVSRVAYNHDVTFIIESLYTCVNFILMQRLPELNSTPIMRSMTVHLTWCAATFVLTVTATVRWVRTHLISHTFDLAFRKS